MGFTKTFYYTLQCNDVCFEVILSHSCDSPSTACHHLHLLDVSGHVRLPSGVSHTSTAFSKHRVGVEPLFCLFSLGPRPCLRKGVAGYHTTCWWWTRAMCHRARRFWITTSSPSVVQSWGGGGWVVVWRLGLRGLRSLRAHSDDGRKGGGPRVSTSPDPCPYWGAPRGACPFLWGGAHPHMGRSPFNNSARRGGGWGGERNPPPPLDPALYPPPPVQRTPCPTNTSVWNVFLWGGT